MANERTITIKVNGVDRQFTVTELITRLLSNGQQSWLPKEVDVGGIVDITVDQSTDQGDYSTITFVMDNGEEFPFYVYNGLNGAMETWTDITNGTQTLANASQTIDVTLPTGKSYNAFLMMIYFPGDGKTRRLATQINTTLIGKLTNFALTQDLNYFVSVLAENRGLWMYDISVIDDGGAGRNSLASFKTWNQSAEVEAKRYGSYGRGSLTGSQGGSFTIDAETEPWPAGTQYELYGKEVFEALGE